MTASYLVYLILEIIWILSYTGYIPLSPTATGLVKYLNTMFIPLMVFFWFWFAEVRFKSVRIHQRGFRILFALPIIFMTLVYLSSFRTGIVFRIMPDGFVEQGPAAALTGIIDNFYGIAIILHASLLTIREKDRFRRKEYWTQIIFILICTIGGILDAVISMTPVMTLAIAFSFVYLFINLLEPQIYNDALTGLNNRRQADRYISAHIPEASAENPFYLFMADIDRFKQINDTMGHLEGDRALKTVAKAVAASADAYHGFAARWGGDEFLVVFRNPNEPGISGEFLKMLSAKLKESSLQSGLSYPLSMSAGCSICRSPQTSISDLIEEADRMLYENKKDAKSIV